MFLLLCFVVVVSCVCVQVESLCVLEGKAKARSPAAATLCAAAEAAGGEWDGGKGAFVFQRYCHVYEKGDLPKLFAPISGWVSVQDEYYDAGNWCVVCRRDK